jgi:hypothetical protein
MSYTITLWCGCRVYVSCDPRTRAAHSRILERRGPDCGDRRHQRGERLRLWEMLPDPRIDERQIEYESEGWPSQRSA